MSCPACGSPKPHLHPPTQEGGMVCNHAYHRLHIPGSFSIGSTVWPGTTKLIEETGELQQVLGKLIAVHGDAEHHWSGNLREKLIDEMGDTMAALKFFSRMNLTAEEQKLLSQRATQKLSLFQRWQCEQS